MRAFLSRFKHKREGSPAPEDRYGGDFHPDDIPEWSKGRDGKGVLTRDGELVTWETTDGWPFHMDMLKKLGTGVPKAYLVIDTDGRTKLQGTNEPEEVWPEIVRQNPSLKLKGVEDYWANEEGFKFGGAWADKPDPEVVHLTKGNSPKSKAEGFTMIPDRFPFIYRPDENKVYVGDDDMHHAHLLEQMHPEWENPASMRWNEDDSLLGLFRNRGKGAFWMADLGQYPNVLRTVNNHFGYKQESLRGWNSDWKFGSSLAEHGHYRNGQRCNCPWGHDQPIHKEAGEYLQRTLNQAKRGDKKLQSPEGQVMLQSLQKMVEENPDYDQLAPYIANRWKRGDILHNPEWENEDSDRPWMQTSPFRWQYRETPTLEDARYRASLNRFNRQQYINQGLIHDPNNEATGEDYFTDEDLNRFNRNYMPRHYMQADQNQRSYYGDLNRQQLHNWNQWLNAGNHPLRQGVNYLAKDWTPIQMADAATQYKEYLDVKAQKERMLPRMKQNSDVVHQFPNGWTVNQVRNAEGLYDEGEAMNHCIGNSEDPHYCNMNDAGDISVYSLRDPEGWPHATWHTNNNYGGVAEVFARSDRALRPHEQEMYEEWAKANNVDPEPVGNMEDTQAYDQYIQLPDSTTVDEYTYRRDNGGYDEAYDHGNVGENTEVNYDNDYDEIMHDAMYNPDNMDNLIRYIQENDIHPSELESFKQAYDNHYGEKSANPIPSLKDYNEWHDRDEAIGPTAPANWEPPEGMKERPHQFTPTQYRMFEYEPGPGERLPHEHPLVTSDEDEVQAGQMWQDYLAQRPSGVGNYAPALVNQVGIGLESPQWQPYHENRTWQWQDDRERRQRANQDLRERRQRQQSATMPSQVDTRKVSFSPPTRQRR